MTNIMTKHTEYFKSCDFSLIILKETITPKQGHRFMKAVQDVHPTTTKKKKKKSCSGYLNHHISSIPHYFCLLSFLLSASLGLVFQKVQNELWLWSRATSPQLAPCHGTQQQLKVI